tara:strand:- start:253 stop:1200 length:948 start_codon:yes stop_codon:yes gene_type:complete
VALSKKEPFPSNARKDIMTFGKGDILSFEFFPPRNIQEFSLLEESCKLLAPYNPTFISFTDGAGGSKNRDIIDAVRIVRKYLKAEIVAHITSCDKEEEDIDNIVSLYLDEKIDSFLIIRGDCPTNEFLMDLDDLEEQINKGFNHASDLISYLSNKELNKIGFGAFPAGHPEDKKREDTIETFRLKVEAGGTFSATQLFFDADEYVSFYEEIRKFDNATPIYAGIMPLVSLRQAERFAEICDITLPKDLIEGFTACTNKEEERDFGLRYIASLCDSLIQQNADGLHFYTLNRSTAFIEIAKKMKRLNLEERKEIGK